MDLSFVQCGYAEAFDYCQLMILKLNSRQWIAQNCTLSGKEMDDLKRADTIAAMYPLVDNRLRIFFDCEYKNASFLSFYLYEMKNSEAVRTLGELQNVIQKDVKFKDKLIHFYLGKEYLTNQDVMYALMTDYKDLASSYKEMLMYFLTFESEYMNLLFDSMAFVKNILQKLYKQKNDVLKQLVDEFDFDLIANRRRTLKKWVKGFDKVEISFSYCNQYVVLIGNDLCENGWMILGCEYLDAVEQKWYAEIPLEKIGNALGDEMRVRIIQEIHKFGETSAPQLAKILNIPSSAVFYHLDVLKRAYLLCSRMKGRTAYYWVDQRTFEYAINELKKLGGLLK